MMAEVGETVVIRKITGNDQVRQHLAEMGFTVDAKVTVVSHLAGNMILNVRDSRVGIGEAMARRILY
jgi:ferrous iron transport protein A